MYRVCAFCFATLHLLSCFVPCSGHGKLAYPASSRQNGSLASAGDCQDMHCFWFSEPVEIRGEPTLNAATLRTYNVNVSSGGRDWSRRMPWRAPGTAPVYGSGCGSAGGGPVRNEAAGGIPPPGYQQGADAVKALPKKPPAVWRQGASEEVAWYFVANHGGGYSYRLCPSNGNVTEECFQSNVLRFAGDVQWIQYGELWQYGEKLPLPRVEIPLVRVTEGTYPKGSQWARNPIPGCLFCDQADCDGLPDQERLVCGGKCGGVNLTFCPPGMTQFPEARPGLSGYGPASHHDRSMPYSIVDRVIVPSDLKPGEYLLSWRWDCEQTAQVFQNCADIVITGSENTIV